MKRLGRETTSRPPAEPNPLFLTHTTAVAGLWLGVKSLPWLRLDSWLREEAAREEWKPQVPGWGQGLKSYRITPDATATVTLKVDGQKAEAAGFFETDMATMTQERLLAKVTRYKRYAESEEWRGRHPHCPVLLLATTSITRARRFIGAVARVEKKSEKKGSWRPPGEPMRDRLVVAACGLLLEPTKAFTEAVWLHDPEAEPVHFGDLLSHAVLVRRDHQAWENAEAAREAALAPRHAASMMTDSGPDPSPHVKDEEAAAILRVFLATYKKQPMRGRDRWTDDHANLIMVVWRWWKEQPKLHSRYEPAAPAPSEVINALKRHQPQMWREQAEALLSATRALERGDPLLPLLAARLVNGNLVDAYRLSQVCDQPLDREQIEKEALGNYAENRDLSICSETDRMNFLQRRRAVPREMADTYDSEHLEACQQCGLVRPKGKGDGTYCRPCGGTYGPYSDRPAPADAHGLVGQLKDALTLGGTDE